MMTELGTLISEQVGGKKKTHKKTNRISLPDIVILFPRLG